MSQAGRSYHLSSSLSRTRLVPVPANPHPLLHSFKRHRAGGKQRRSKARGKASRRKEEPQERYRMPRATPEVTGRQAQCTAPWRIPVLRSDIHLQVALRVSLCYCCVMPLPPPSKTEIGKAQRIIGTILALILRCPTLPLQEHREGRSVIVSTVQEALELQTGEEGVVRVSRW
ncbi:hypothetical protein E2C01_035413 [Portunus trituberculatus]|uniref:Uncharacterized protein n=1 Tax=Portunus trituberculatus TaxID=210409 RepID=A0A5B7F8E1_PORTR|nr:hypothetical protein [Portunus trituberculatus]